MTSISFYAIFATVSMVEQQAARASLHAWHSDRLTKCRKQMNQVNDDDADDDNAGVACYNGGIG